MQSNQRLRYLATNENLLAIRHGLNLGPEDTVLSIAGAGDQVFSILEFVKKIVVVDSNPKQLLYLQKQIALLNNRDFLSFIKPDLLRTDPAFGFDVEQIEAFNDLGLVQRKKYFTPARLNSIRKKLDVVLISPSTVLDAFETHAFNKAYLTNIMGYTDSDFSKDSLLFAGANKIQVGGLIYVSNASIRPDFLNFMENLGLQREERLTAVARSLEPHWKPDVFKRNR